MTTLTRLLALLFSMVLATGLLAPPAQADDWNINPMVQKSTDAGWHTVLVEAPDNVYGLRPTIWDFEDRTNGIDFVAAKGTKCSDNPDVTCLRVFIKDYGSGKFPDPETGPCQSWAGACASWGGSDPYLWVNTDTGVTDSNLMCHEWGHTLGHQHHNHQGCVGQGGRDTLTWAEINALARNTPGLVSLQP